jgi:hypothetical protein
MVKQLVRMLKVRPTDGEAAGYDVEGTVLQMVKQLDMMLKVPSYRW